MTSPINIESNPHKADQQTNSIEVRDKKTRMKITNLKTRLGKAIGLKTTAKIAAAIAISAAFWFAVSQDSESVADSPTQPVSSQQLTIIPDDEWLFGHPYFEIHPDPSPGPAKVAPANNLRIIPDDEWFFGG